MTVRSVHEDFTGSSYGLAAAFVVLAGALALVFSWQDAGPTIFALWLAVGALVPVLAVAWVIWRKRTDARWAGLATAAATSTIAILAIWLSAVLHWKYLLVFGVLATALTYRMLVPSARELIRIPTLLFVVGLSWLLTLGFSYTHLLDWSMNATSASTLAIPLFIATFILILYNVMRDDRKPRPAVWAHAEFGIACVLFLALGLRLDNELSTWVPYHQSYFIAPAAMVRQHHWLLWDVPSQYGFLSILAIAILPGATTYDAFHLCVALALLVQAAIVYGILRDPSRGWPNYVFAVALTVACFYSSQSSYYPFGPRLYPQEGLRFLWLIAILWIAYNHFRVRRMRTVFFVLGCAVWICSVAWSFETGIWTTVTWLAYLGVDSVIDGMLRGNVSETLRTALRRILVLCAVTGLAVGLVQSIYIAHFGHGPDWLSYVEFSAIYASSGGTFLTRAMLSGAGWSILLILTAVASLAIHCLVHRRYEQIPLLAACWAAMWAAASYYVGEPFNQHVNMLAGVMVTVGAIVVRITYEDDPAAFVPMLSRLSFVPLFVLLIAFAFASPQRIRAVIIPHTIRQVTHFSSSLPVVSGELRTLEKKAGISASDAVIYPSSPVWVKLTTGVILPLEKKDNGDAYERRAWLPLSPLGAYNTWLTLPLSRRITYVERYLDDENAQGWYVTYHETARCTDLSPRLRTVRAAATSNYSAVLCELIHGSRWQDVQFASPVELSRDVLMPNHKMKSVLPTRLPVRGKVQLRFRIPRRMRDPLNLP